MLDPVDETFVEFVDTCLTQVQMPQLQRKFAALGGVDLVVRLIAMSMNDEVIIKACRALSVLLQIEGHVGDSSVASTPRSTPQQSPRQPALAQIGAGVSTLGVASAPRTTSISSAASVCSATSSTRTSRRSHAVVYAAKICGAGGVAALIAQMRRSRNDRVLQETAAALKHLTRVYASTKQLPDWEGVSHLFEDVEDAYAVIVYLFKRSHRSFVHREIAETVHYISLLPNGQRLGQVGAIEALVGQCMATGQLQRGVLVWVCTALCVLVMDDANRRQFMLSDGPTALIELLRRTPATSMAVTPADLEWDEVVVGILHTLSNFTAGEGASVHKFQMAIDSVGGAEEIVKRCRAAVWFANGKASVSRGMTTGATRSTANGPCSPRPNPIVCKTPHPSPISPFPGNGTLAGAPMSPGGSLTSPLVSPHGVAGGGGSRMKERLVEQCCGALCNLSCENDALRIKLGELGACELLVSVCHHCSHDMRSRSHQRILEQACAVIGNMCKRNRLNRQKLSAIHGPETLCYVLSRCLSIGHEADDVALQALRAVSNMVMRNEENQHRFADAGGCQHLVQFCFATQMDKMLRWVLVTLVALAQDELLRYRLVNEGALAAAAAAERSAGSVDTKEALKSLMALLPLPTSVLSSVILSEVDEDVSVQATDDAWVPAATTRICNHPGTNTSLSTKFVEHCQRVGHGIKDVQLHAAQGDDMIDRQKIPAGLTRIRVKVRQGCPVTIDVTLDGSHEEDIILGPALLAKLKTLGFQHMINQYITF